MLKYNIVLLKKLEKLLEEAGYLVRYEKGNFQSGYCVLETKKVVVINKFHSLDARINSLMEILTLAEINTDQLDPDALEFIQQIREEKKQGVSNL